MADSFRKRYFFKVFSSVFSAATSVVVQSIIPRGLGALAYGNFNFLTDFFTQVLGFLNMGTSTAFYTKLSKRPDESPLVLFYLSYIILATMLVLLGVWIAGGLGWSQKLWPGQGMEFVFMAVIFAGMMWLQSSTNDMIDAYGLTVKGEIVKIIQRVLGLGLILLLFWKSCIYMRNIFIYQYVLMLTMIVLFFYLMRKNGFEVQPSRIKGKGAAAYGREFYRYSQPLFLYALGGLVVGIFDRWFLQWCNGGVQQGFYSLAFKIGAVCFLLSSSMTQLITREFSIAHHKQDYQLMAQLFRRHIPLLYALTAIMCCFVAANADKATLIMGGKEFKGALLPVAIMALYPMHQTYGQLSGAVFYATDQVRLYRNIGLIVMFLELPCTYFLLASPVHFGLGLGATGLAVKVVAANILSVNVLLYFNTKFLKLPFFWYVIHQLINVIVFLGLALFVRICLDHLFLGKNVLFHFLGDGFVYLLMVAAVVYIAPGLLGLHRQDILRFLNKKPVLP